MRKITIKALILSLSLLSVSNVDCSPPVAAALGSALIYAVGPILGALTVGFLGGAIFTGYKVGKYVFSRKNMSKEEREKIKKRIREAREKRRIERRKKRAAKRKSKKSAEKKVDIQTQSLPVT